MQTLINVYLNKMKRDEISSQTFLLHSIRHIDPRSADFKIMFVLHLKSHRVCARGLLSEAGGCVEEERGQREVMRWNALKQGTCFKGSLLLQKASLCRRGMKGLLSWNLKRDLCLDWVWLANKMKMSGHEKSNTNECSLGGGEGREDGVFFNLHFFQIKLKQFKNHFPLKITLRNWIYRLCLALWLYGWYKWTPVKREGCYLTSRWKRRMEPE